MTPEMRKQFFLWEAEKRREAALKTIDEAVQPSPKIPLGELLSSKAPMNLKLLAAFDVLGRDREGMEAIEDLAVDMGTDAGMMMDTGGNAVPLVADEIRKAIVIAKKLMAGIGESDHECGEVYNSLHDIAAETYTEDLLPETLGFLALGHFAFGVIIDAGGGGDVGTSLKKCRHWNAKSKFAIKPKEGDYPEWGAFQKITDKLHRAGGYIVVVTNDVVTDVYIATDVAGSGVSSEIQVAADQMMDNA